MLSSFPFLILFTERKGRGSNLIPNSLLANSANDQTVSSNMDSDQLQDWIKATPAASTLHRRLLAVLESTAEEHSSHTGTRSPTDQPVLTSDACRAMLNTSAGGGIYQALRRLLCSSFTDRQSVADWF